MSSDIFHELNPVLVAQVDAFAEVLEQRNLARDAAICLEQELAAANAEAGVIRDKAREWQREANQRRETSSTEDERRAYMLDRCAGEILSLLVIPDAES